MGRIMILNREQSPAARFFNVTAAQSTRRPSLEELERQLEVLRGKFQTLRMAHDRIEREVQKVANEIEAIHQNAKSARA